MKKKGVYVYVDSVASGSGQALQDILHTSYTHRSTHVSIEQRVESCKGLSVCRLGAHSRSAYPRAYHTNKDLCTRVNIRVFVRARKQESLSYASYT